MIEDPVQTAPALLIGDTAPGFRARSTTGPVAMSDFRGKWLVFFSHPADFTPVCTSEFVAFAQVADRLEEMNCALMGLSVDSLYSHFAWVRMIRDRFGVEVRFPVVEDPSLVIGRAYGMVGEESSDASSVRTVFIIDPDQVIRATICYPVEIGRSVQEVVRAVSALQAADAARALAPEGWEPGEPLLASPEPTLDDIFGDGDPTGWFLRESGDG